MLTVKTRHFIFCLYTIMYTVGNGHLTDEGDFEKMSKFKYTWEGGRL